MVEMIQVSQRRMINRKIDYQWTYRAITMGGLILTMLSIGKNSKVLIKQFMNMIFKTTSGLKWVKDE